VPWRRVLLIPLVHPDICIGCGACEFACPTEPYKAIYVDGNKVHQIADKPVFWNNRKLPQLMMIFLSNKKPTGIFTSQGL
jgi:ferredoxin